MRREADTEESEVEVITRSEDEDGNLSSLDDSVADKNYLPSANESDSDNGSGLETDDVNEDDTEDSQDTESVKEVIAVVEQGAVKHVVPLHPSDPKRSNPANPYHNEKTRVPRKRTIKK